LAPEAQEAFGLLDAAALFVHVHDRPSVEAARRVGKALRNREFTARSLADVARATAAGPAFVQALYRRRVRALQSAGGRPSTVWLEVWVEQAPKESRRLSLANTRDAFGRRETAVTWSCDPEELDTSRRLTRWIGEDLERLGIARLHELPAMADDDAWRASVRDASHPAGTTRMSDRPDMGVVDRDLAVHGVRGLYVLGASVFPTSGYANPTLTVVALAVRLARHLMDSA